MHNFRKVIVSVLCILILFSALSYILIVPYLNSEYDFYQDSKLRKELEGTIDFIALGSSDVLSGLVPDKIDQELGCTSYNLSNLIMTMHAKKFFLEKELARNPVSTVILEISYDTLKLDGPTDNFYGDAFSIARLDSSAERHSFLHDYLRLDDYPSLYARLFLSSLQYWGNRILQHDLHNIDYSLKGFHPLPQNDISLNEITAKKQHNSWSYSPDYLSDNIQILTSMIDMCQQKGIEVIVITVPVSDQLIWNYDSLDAFYDWSHEFCEDNNVKYYDFNLLKNRFELFSDSATFYDFSHLSVEGADIFTEVFCNIVKKAQNEDVSDYFYDSYSDMKADSPYMKYLK